MLCWPYGNIIHMKLCELRGVATGWTGADMSTAVLPENVLAINAISVTSGEFTEGGGGSVC